MRNGRIVIAGGRNVTQNEWNLDDIISCDPGSDAWLTLGRLPKPLLAPVVASVGGRVFVATGAQEGNRTKTDEAWSGIPAQGWLPGPSMPIRLGEVAGGIIRGRLYSSAMVIPDVAMDLGTGEWEGPTGFRFGHLTDTTMRLK